VGPFKSLSVNQGQLPPAEGGPVLSPWQMYQPRPNAPRPQGTPFQFFFLSVPALFHCKTQPCETYPSSQLIITSVIAIVTGCLDYVPSRRSSFFNGGMPRILRDRGRRSKGAGVFRTRPARPMKIAPNGPPAESAKVVNTGSDVVPGSNVFCATPYCLAVPGMSLHPSPRAPLCKRQSGELKSDSLENDGTQTRPGSTLILSSRSVSIKKRHSLEWPIALFRPPASNSFPWPRGPPAPKLENNFRSVAVLKYQCSLCLRETPKEAQASVQWTLDAIAGMVSTRGPGPGKPGYTLP